MIQHVIVHLRFCLAGCDLLVIHLSYRSVCASLLRILVTSMCVWIGQSYRSIAMCSHLIVSICVASENVEMVTIHIPGRQVGEMKF